MERIVYINNQTPNADPELPESEFGFYIVYLEDDGSEQSYDAIGPFDTHAQALMVQLNSTEE